MWKIVRGKSAFTVLKRIEALSEKEVMCIFTDKVDKVSKTRIFASLVAPYTQFTVYSNEVVLSGENSFNDNSYWSSFDPSYMRGLHIYDPPSQRGGKGKPVAMVLAIPLVHGDVKSIKMVDMSNCKRIFDNLERTVTEETVTYSRNVNVRDTDTLAVKRCGSYSYSVVPDIESFAKLKHRLFNIDPQLVETMKRNYGKKYAFLVCIIDKTAEYTPIAYVHASDGKRLFIPTLHDHGHGWEEYTDDWDHSIYTIDRDDKTYVSSKNLIYAKVDKSYKKPDLENFPYKNLDWSRLKRRKIEGYNPNGDILIKA